MNTVTAIIGNSDDKLLQQEWSAFCQEFYLVVFNLASKLHHVGHSLPNSAFQNHSIVFEISSTNLGRLRPQLANLTKNYHQESIALIVADGTEFVGPA